MTKIQFREYGRVFVDINIKVFDAAIMRPATFKVDTGADFTTISKVNLLDLGYDASWIVKNAVVFQGDARPMTASGDIINAGYVVLPLINILGLEGKNWPFQIIMDEKQDFRNLLGRDLLTGFNYSFDNDEDVFSIARAKAFKARLPFLPGQEIHDVGISCIGCQNKGL